MRPEPVGNKSPRSLAVRVLLALCLLMGVYTPCLASQLETFVSIPPHKFLVEKIGGTHVTVHVLVERSQDPHSFEPSPRQIAALGKTRLYFLSGLPFEKFILAKLSTVKTHPEFINTSAGITKRPNEEEHAGHAHGTHDNADPHVWLSLPLVKVQAENILNALIAEAPEHEQEFRKNKAALDLETDTLHQKLQTVLAPYRGQFFYVFHPAFGYFGDAYGLIQKAVESGGKTPHPQQLTRLIRQARADNAKIIFVQPQFDRRSATAVATAIGGAVVEMDPLPEDIFIALATMGDELAKALR